SVEVVGGPPVSSWRVRPTVAHHERMTRWHFRNAGENAEVIRYVAETQIGDEGATIHVGGHPWRLCECLQLGREDEASRAFGIVERLDPQSVAGEKQSSACRLPDREREHPL